MPNRILRDYTDSLAFAGISAEAERLWARLLVKVDDYGRFHADPRLIRAACFPFADDLRANDLVRWLDELSHRQLLLRYEVGGREYLAVPKFRQRARAAVSRYPSPDGQPPDWMPPDPGPPTVGCPTDDGQMTVNCQSEDGQPRAYSETKTKAETYSKARAPTGADGRAREGRWPPLGECLLVADVRGVPKECAEKWWHEHDARGGTDKHGQPLARWESSLLAYAATWRANEEKEKQRHAKLNSRPSGVRPDRNANTANATLVGKYTAAPGLIQA